MGLNIDAIRINGWRIETSFLADCVDAEARLQENKSPSVGLPSPRRREVLVTGGAGFIGSHAAEEFLADEYDVTVLDNLDTYYDDGIKRLNLEHCENVGSGRFLEVTFSE